MRKKQHAKVVVAAQALKVALRCFDIRSTQESNARNTKRSPLFLFLEATSMGLPTNDAITSASKVIFFFPLTREKALARLFRNALLLLLLFPLPSCLFSSLEFHFKRTGESIRCTFCGCQAVLLRRPSPLPIIVIAHKQRHIKEEKSGHLFFLFLMPDCVNNSMLTKRRRFFRFLFIFPLTLKTKTEWKNMDSMR